MKKQEHDLTEKAYSRYYRTLGRIESERRMKENMAAQTLATDLTNARKAVQP